MRVKLLLLFFLLISFSISGQSRTLSNDAEISILTVGPGTSLNDAFGHSAFRVKDTKTNIDLAFGYGAYDFNAPNFYLKFAQGKLNYSISVDYFKDFLATYTYFNRSIDEQVLNLNQEEKQQLYNYLLNNARPENKFYLYDFFYDNCATKIKDVAQSGLNNSIVFATPNDFQSKTFRSLIQENLNRNSWGSLGIDIALGSVIDKPTTAEDYMFLPKYIHSFFNSATLKSSEPLVKTSRRVFSPVESSRSSSFIYSPLFILGLISFIIMYITYRDVKKNTRSKTLDLPLFLITGLVGVGILLLWFATDHTATAYNYNLLWAFPLNILMLAQVLKTAPKAWFKKYIKFLIVLLCLMTLHWIMGVQVFAIGLTPLIIALLLRYIYLVKHI